MIACAVCERPMRRALNGVPRPMIVCSTCDSKSTGETRAAEDRYWRAQRELFEGAARVWAANTMRREG